jgi:hypothetical protein
VQKKEIGANPVSAWGDYLMLNAAGMSHDAGVLRKGSFDAEYH